MPVASSSAFLNQCLRCTLLYNLLLSWFGSFGELCSTLLSRFSDDLSSVSRNTQSFLRLYPCIGVPGHSAPAPASAMSDRNAAAGVGDRVGDRVRDDSPGRFNHSDAGCLFECDPIILIIVFAFENTEKQQKKSHLYHFGNLSANACNFALFQKTRSVDQ